MSSIVIAKSESQISSLVAQGLSLVYFAADWCGPCKNMEKVLLELDFEDEDVSIIKVDVDDEQFAALAERHRVRGIPNTHLYQDGKLISNLVGYHQPDVVLDLVSKTFS